MPLTTQFAPAEREDKRLISEQTSSFLQDQNLVPVLDAIITPLLILNKYRQIVYANKSFLELVNISDPALILGMRPGEAIGCIHATENKGGCGTTNFCSECGAVRAILSGIRGDTDIQECRILLDDDPSALDLRVMSTPLEKNDEQFTVFSIIDIADEKRREILEQLFLHDLSNMAGGIHGLIRLLCNAPADKMEKYRPLIYDLSDKLLDEIKAHRQLMEAENKKLTVNPVEIYSLEILKQAKTLYMNHDIARDKKIIIDPRSENITFKSDNTILLRVVGNMTKNALEAIHKGMEVTLSCAAEKGCVVFSVHNPGVIPHDAQLQIFQRSFSTKGSGRGLGTYSIKLLSEQYLKGKVGFNSSEKKGTVFYGKYPMTIHSG